MFTTPEEAVASGRGVEVSYLCPDHDDTRPSASVNRLSGLYYCYTCGSKGKVGGNYKVREDDIDSEVAEILMEAPTYPSLYLDSFDSGPVHPYWLGRFTEETCRHFRLGFDYTTGCPCYPFWADGTLMGIVRRVPDEGGGKYRYPKGVKTSHHLFNHDPYLHRTVMLVESATTAMAVWEAGYVAYGIYGSNYTPQQARLLARNGPEVILTAFDNDYAGRKVTEMVRELHPYAEVRSLDWSPFDDDVSDLGDLDLKTRTQALDSLALCG